MPGWFLVSFHGGKTDSSINNLGVFGADGTVRDPFYALGPALASTKTLSVGALPALNELRAVLSTAEALYVVNAYKDFSQLLTFAPAPAADGFWAFTGIFADKGQGLSHPFDVVAGPDGLYVSNQDANNVVHFVGPGSKATVVLSGLEAVRGLAWDGNVLYVADSGANLVYLVTGAAAPVPGSKPAGFAVTQPVHLLYDGVRYLFVGSESGNSVLVYDTQSSPSKTNPRTLIEGSESGLDHTSGLALISESSTTATLFAASRVGRQVLQYPLTLSDGSWTWDSTKPSTFLHRHQLGDDPEFVTAVS